MYLLLLFVTDFIVLQESVIPENITVNTVIKEEININENDSNYSIRRDGDEMEFEVFIVNSKYYNYNFY